MKTYVKPELFYESFALSQSIAACNFSEVQACTGGGVDEEIDIPGGWSDSTTCTIVVNISCHTNGGEGGALLSS